MRSLSIIILFLFSLSVFAVDCGRNPIYCQILKNKPSIDKSYGMYLSNLIYKYSRQYKIDPAISVCIAYQENKFRNKDRTQAIAIPSVGCANNNCGLTTIKGISDFGVFQIHIGTANNYKLDINRLSNDLDYAVESHMKILKSKMKLCDYLQEDSWTCYHSTTKYLRLYYKKLIKERCEF